MGVKLPGIIKIRGRERLRKRPYTYVNVETHVILPMGRTRNHIIPLEVFISIRPAHHAKIGVISEPYSSARAALVTMLFK